MEGAERIDCQKAEGNLMITEMFTTLIATIDLWVHTEVKTHQVTHLNMHHAFCVITTTKLFFKKNEFPLLVGNYHFNIAVLADIQPSFTTFQN